MSSENRKIITETQWEWAVEAYELGTKHGAQIARELDVSPATISREFKRRGCRKACRVAEIVTALEAVLDAKDRVRARQRAAEEAAATERCATLCKSVTGQNRVRVVKYLAANAATAKAGRKPTRNDHSIA